MLVDFRLTGRLRGAKPLDPTAALGPVIGALAQDEVKAAIDVRRCGDVAPGELTADLVRAPA